MSPDGTVVASHVWKRFRADRGRWSLASQWAFLRDRRQGREHEHWRYALQDIDVRIAPGEAVGLVGPNGSGKSTLLKVLTQVMQPYAGSVDVAGRVGALIEVKAGIHAELTGRENVYLYGSLLGLKRSEIAARFDRIVDFAELGDAIDRQVKFFSSGMQMRLGFSVAAHLDPDVLLVDEVLAVGDATFQQRCHDRMREVLAEGTTLVLVSHDLAAVEATCDRCLLLNGGALFGDGPIRDVLAEYRSWIEETAAASADVEGIIALRKASAAGEGGGTARSDGPLEVQLVVESAERRRASLFVGISEGPATPVLVLRRNLQLAPGETEITCRVASLPLPRGRFYLWVGAWEQGWSELLPWHPAASFDVFGQKLVKAPQGIVRLSPVQVGATWTEAAR